MSGRAGSLPRKMADTRARPRPDTAQPPVSILAGHHDAPQTAAQVILFGRRAGRLIATVRKQAQVVGLCKAVSLEIGRGGGLSVQPAIEARR